MAAAQQDVRIGTAGWGIPRIEAERFPGDGSHLERYSRVLSCAEINSTFYRLPRASTWERWAESTPEDFRFSVKAPRAITHECALAPTAAQLRGFVQEAHRLGLRLGPLLFQLPPKQALAPEQARSFLSLLREAEADLPIALEPRHATWFTPEADALLRTFRIARVAADPAPAKLPPDAPSHLPGGYPGLTYFRLHGSPRIYYSSYSDAYLAALSTTLRNLATATERWVVFDNTASGAALGNALKVQARSVDFSEPFPYCSLEVVPRGVHV